MLRLSRPTLMAIPRWAAGLALALLIVTLGASSSGPAPAGVSVERGRYLSHAVCECFECHSPLQDNDLVEPIASRLGAGDILNKKTRHVAPNITPDEETGAGRWSDEQLVRAIRDGIGHDGRRLSLVMPYPDFGILTDDDVRSIVAYLRTLPPIRNRLPHWIPTDAAERPKVPMRHPPTAAQLATPLGRGEYLVRIARCGHCHTPRPLSGTFRERRLEMEFGGGRRFETKPTFDELETDPGSATRPAVDPGPPEGFVTSPNITTDPSGIPYYTESIFIQTIRTGRVAGVRPLTRAMVWFEFRKLNDEDLKAIFLFLRSVPPVKHRVSNSDPPTWCPRCGRFHGLGDSNAP